MSNPPGRQLDQISCHLASEEALNLLRRALEQAELEESKVNSALSSSIRFSKVLEKGGAISSDENSDDHGTSHQSLSSSSTEEENDVFDDDDDDDDSILANSALNNSNANDSFAPSVTSLPSTSLRSQETMPKSRNAARKNHPNKLDQSIKQLGRPPCYSFPLGPDSTLFLDVPMSILSRHERRNLLVDSPALCRSFLHTGEVLSHKPVLVLLLRSGRFAGGVFLGMKCLVHRACQRYTVRRGQGKAQSSQDNSKKKAKSMGAQLRRAGEQSLREDITSTINEWQKYLSEASLIFLSCPKTMKKNLFEDLNEWIARDDERLRDVPLDVGRPTFENVCAVYEVLLTLVVRETQQQANAIHLIEAEQIGHEGTRAIGVNEHKEIRQDKPQDVNQEANVISLGPLHLAAQAGDFITILHFLDTSSSSEITEQIDQRAGVDFMTPLHYAAQSSSSVDPATAAACVSALLIQGHANPSLVDIRIRPPYFLAAHEKVRDAFRIARAKLGEEHCRWDEDAKVGPALTAEGIEARKEKEAEKKRRKKEKQKEKKLKEKIQSEEVERRRQQEEEIRRSEQEAKRVRDGLQPKKWSAGNVCDYCQKVCMGKLRHQMYKRLEYAYCGTECVEKHKRELMAAAALARLGQNTRNGES